MPVIESLKKLALLGAVGKPIKISSSEFSQHISSSSKTAARLLKNLEDEGYIDRKLVSGGQMVTITKNGIKLLKNEYADYQNIFCSKCGAVELHGHLITGLGEGQYYIGLDGYKHQFEKILDFTPFPGTLNLQLTDLSNSLRNRIDTINASTISGFTDGERTFGGGKCYPIKIEDIDGAVIVPDRSHYPDDLLEIIAPVNLRNTLRLKDGDEIKIIVGNDKSE
ncbi:MAG: winged helix-turn-helix domain-containing protein/riboflavin kinase [Methanosarcinaceae archaeon]|nr:winged helix-turn-helix domain-containing protein/riboflavin kinase [Methanosarcinaceae archaeon]MDF1532950.1 winged helix-turn-helix domain-containing protein/riboflavin kinase [Methanosarcinaceae archaeon]